MKLKTAIASVAVAALLSGAALSASAANNGFAALQGVEAQTLSVEEMQAISGQLNAYDIAAGLTARAANQGEYPRLQAATLKLAQYYLDNAATINARYEKLGVLTPCKTCAP